MKIRLCSADPVTAATPVVFCVFGSNWRTQAVALDALTTGNFSAELARQGFSGGVGSAAVFQTHGALPAAYVVALGVGEGAGSAPWYSCAQAVINRSSELRAARVTVVLAAPQASAAAIEYFAEGIELGRYRFTELKGAGLATLVANASASASAVDLSVPAVNRELKVALERGQVLARAACYARDLINRPAAIVTPIYLAKEARALARRQRLTVKVLDEAGMKRLGMGAVLGVAQGSAQPPRFIELIYKPSKAARRCISLVGKGITFDSGGLSLKPAGAMESQKRDMAGGAVMLAVMSVIRDLAPAVEVRAYVPATENMPGSCAMKPGDVLTALNGKTIEVLNTDAEGRLVLADALSYAGRAKPDVMIDMATLTGAVRAALGPRYAGILGSDCGVVADLIEAGRESGELLWELPLIEEYRSDIDSSVADIKNVGEGYAGTIVAALFLREFTAGIPWAHIDFSSTVVTSKSYPGHPRGATGFGVRTLLRYLLRAS